MGERLSSRLHRILIDIDAAIGTANDDTAARAAHQEITRLEHEAKTREHAEGFPEFDDWTPLEDEL